MNLEERAKYKKVLLEINKELPSCADSFDLRRNTITYIRPTKEACAIADIAGILYKVLDHLEVKK